MSSPNNAIASWQQDGTRVALTTSSAGTGTTGYKLHDECRVVWPAANRRLVRRSLAAGGGPQPQARNFVLGRTAPAFQLRLPVTPIGTAIAWQSLLQDTNWSVSKYILGPWSAPIVGYYMYLEAGIAGEKSVLQAVGVVVTSITLDLPAVTDEDPGYPMWVCDCVAISGSELDAFAITSLTADTAVPLTSRDVTLKVAGTLENFLGGSFTWTNNAVKSKNIGSTPDGMFVRELGVTGNIRMYQTTASGDLHDDMVVAHTGKTAKEIQVLFSGIGDVSFDSLVSAIEYEEEDEIRVVKASFVNIDVDQTQPIVQVTTADQGW